MKEKVGIGEEWLHHQDSTSSGFWRELSVVCPCLGWELWNSVKPLAVYLIIEIFALSTGSETHRADPQQTPSVPGAVRSRGWGCVWMYPHRERQWECEVRPLRRTPSRSRVMDTTSANSTCAHTHRERDTHIIESENCWTMEPWNHGITELFRLEKTCRIIKSNLQPNSTMPNKTYHTQPRWRQRWGKSHTLLLSQRPALSKDQGCILPLCFNPLSYFEVILVLLWTGIHCTFTTEKAEIIVASHLRFSLHLLCSCQDLDFQWQVNQIRLIITLCQVPWEQCTHLRSEWSVELMPPGLKTRGQAGAQPGWVTPEHGAITNSALPGGPSSWIRKKKNH